MVEAIGARWAPHRNRHLLKACSQTHQQRSAHQPVLQVLAAFNLNMRQGGTSLGPSWPSPRGGHASILSSCSWPACGQHPSAAGAPGRSGSLKAGLQAGWPERAARQDVKIASLAGQALGSALVRFLSAHEPLLTGAAFTCFLPSVSGPVSCDGSKLFIESYWL